MVLEVGLEPTNRKALDPKSNVFANFTTRAQIYLKNRAISIFADSAPSDACAIFLILSVP